MIAFVTTNNSFLDDIAFDGMRKHLDKEFTKIIVINLGGNVRKQLNTVSAHNIFGIRVEVSITV